VSLPQASTRLFAKIRQTRAIDGMQSELWDEFQATWNYSPDDGLNLVIERVKSPAKSDLD